MTEITVISSDHCYWESRDTRMRSFFVYILTNSHHTVLYIGVTNDLERRMAEHRQGCIEGFTKQYNLHKLIHFEESIDIEAAIEREKQLKKWSRKKKEWLIELENPTWRDLSLDW